MNKYSKDGKFIIDGFENKWECEKPHPLPLPEGLHAFIGEIYFGNRMSEWDVNNEVRYTHWIARSKLPSIPKPKTQSELDEELAVEWVRKKHKIERYKAMDGSTVAVLAFKEGLKRGRKEKK